MKRIPGMSMEHQASYRRSLIHAALTGVCTNPEAHCGTDMFSDRDVARAAITIANSAVDLLGTETPSVTEAIHQLLVYTVQPGDTLEEIADRFAARGYMPELTARLAKLNRITNPNHIEPGWELIIPAEWR